MADERSDLQEQLRDLELNLELIRARKKDYVIATEIPMHLLRDERKLQDQMKELQQRIDRMTPTHGAAETTTPAQRSVESLTGRQIKQIHEALLDAFPRPDMLKQMVFFQLDEHLEHITTSNSMSAMVFELIEWTRARGRLAELLRGALENNPGNVLLRRCVDELLP